MAIHFIRKVRLEMAELEKFTDDGVMMLLKHSDRQLKNDSNKDIIEAKKDLNYSTGMELNGLSKEIIIKKFKTTATYMDGVQKEKPKPLLAAVGLLLFQNLLVIIRW